MKITIEIDGVPIRETFTQELVGAIEQTVEPQDKPACKARRFLLVDEQANETEGVLWPSGWVSLDAGAVAGDGRSVSWEAFKATYPGCGVQWIDQEVAE